jgi:hypothetical protein
LLVAAFFDSVQGTDGNADRRYRRSLINGRPIDPTTRRVLRRYRNQVIATVRMDTLLALLAKFNLTYKDFYAFAESRAAEQQPS